MMENFMSDFPTDSFDRTARYNTADNTADNPADGTPANSQNQQNTPHTQNAPGPTPPGGPSRLAGAASRLGTPRAALVVLVAIGLLALAFVVMVIVGVSSESINALAVLATPIAAMVAAYYGITLSMQQVTSERAEKEAALRRAQAAEALGRESEVWAAQLESGLRVAMAKMTAAQLRTDEVTKAAGTPDGFF
jgi:hypothetical protein